MSPADEPATLPAPHLPTATPFPDPALGTLLAVPDPDSELHQPVATTDAPRLPTPSARVATETSVHVPDTPHLPSPLPTTAATPSMSPLILDGDLPRLAVAAPVPAVSMAMAAPDAPDPVVEADLQPPAVGPDASPQPAHQPAHPMAHLMPEKAAPSEASLKAAQLRAAKKAKARKVKVGVAVGAVVVAAVLGPPLFRWVNDAINEAGATTEQPER